jgi:YbbR domain-containing protein
LKAKSFRIYIYSLFFALIVWIYLSLNYVYTVNLDIPLSVEPSKNQSLSDDYPENIQVSLQGKGWDIFNVMLSGKLRYNIDLAKEKRDSRVLTSQFLSERLNLPPNLSVIKISPDTLFFNFEKSTEKIVKVKNNIKVNLKEGYQVVGNPLITPDSVKITGLAAYVNKIKYIPTDALVFNDVNSNISTIVNLKDTLSSSIKIIPGSVEVKYIVQLSAEKDFQSLEINIVNLPPDKEIILIPPTINISLRGGVDQLSRLNNNDINVFIEYKAIESDTLGYIVPKINFPVDASVIYFDPQKIQYIIKKKL